MGGTRFRDSWANWFEMAPVLRNHSTVVGPTPAEPCAPVRNMWIYSAFTDEQVFFRSTRLDLFISTLHCFLHGSPSSRLVLA